MPFCIDCGIQYSCSAEDHRSVCNRGVLVFSNRCSYKAGLRTFCRRHRIPYRIIDCHDVWVRDIFLETPTRLYIRNKNSAYARKDAFEECAIVIPSESYARDRDNHIADPIMKDSNKRRIDHQLFHSEYIIKSTNRALEGGNLFICENTDGVKYYIIGECALEGDAIIANQKLKMSGELLEAYDPAKCKARYEKIFEVDGVTSRVLILPNLTYHLDLYIAYIAKGKFLVNAFLDKSARSGVDETYIAKREESRRVVEILKQHSFEVTSCVATRYLDIDDQHVVWKGSANRSNLINGINLTSNTDGKDYFLTIDSHENIHKMIMGNSLRAFHVTPVFINQDGCNARQTQEHAIANSGALRCQTAIISKLDHRNTFANIIQKNYRRYRQRK